MQGRRGTAGRGVTSRDAGSGLDEGGSGWLCGHSVHAVAHIDDPQARNCADVLDCLLDGVPTRGRFAIELHGAMSDAGIGAARLVERFEIGVVEQVTSLGDQHEVVHRVAVR